MIASLPASPPVGLPQPSRFDKGATGHAEDVGDYLGLEDFTGVPPDDRPGGIHYAFQDPAHQKCYRVTFLSI
jgi:hypothetical protein